ncbi:MAG: hypothetical protein FGM57_02575 [Candidatus Taylorbacteria bacterium]|nr:hypothetical protein [Candidatus Taylorbacteria bacterium]
MKQKKFEEILASKFVKIKIWTGEGSGDFDLFHIPTVQIQFGYNKGSGSVSLVLTSPISLLIDASIPVFADYLRSLGKEGGNTHIFLWQVDYNLNDDSCTFSRFGSTYTKALEREFIFSLGPKVKIEFA